MKRNAMLKFTCLLMIYVTCVCDAAGQTGYHQFVDPFIGSEGVGNVTVGPSCPFGMVKPGPDCSRYANSGYRPDLAIPVYGFSQLHVSGTGGGAKYGNISVMPFAGALDSIAQTSLRQDEKTTCGYYSVQLKKHGIQTEITASHKTAFYRFGFETGANKSVKLDAGSFLNESNNLQEEEAQFLVGSEIQVLNDHEVSGYNRVRGGWNGGEAYTVFFHAIFDRPFKTYKTWKGAKLYQGVNLQADNGEKTGVLLAFGNTGANVIQVKIGISFISTAKAGQNAATEIPGWDFKTVLQETEQKWESLLSKIEIDKNTSLGYKKMFYTGLYHTMLMPVDRTGENPLWKNDKPYYDDFYAIWDTYRTSHPLITLIAPKRQADIVEAILDIYQHDGYMPDARSGNSNGRTQGGSNAAVLIADAYVKGLEGIDYKLALKAMLEDADIPPGGKEEKEGRGGLPDYNILGFVSTTYPRSGTRTVEYAYNDFCMATVARGLGETKHYERFKKQSNNWQNLWRNYNHHGANGFIMPKDSKGNWVDSFICDRGKNTSISFTPLNVDVGQCICWWCGFLYEANSWEYSLYVPHDVAGLIQISGGAEAFRKRLDTFFINRYYNVGNEPSFLSPMLYHWLGKSYMSSNRIRKIVAASFNERRKGLPGNDDSGAMSSWLAFNMLGLFPNAGQPYYLLNAPFFAESEIHLGNGKSFKTIAGNLSASAIYIQSASLNGKPLTRSWLEHSQLMKGGTLQMEMGDEPTGWGSTELPPSMRF